jgi:negative regulator of flagellin synthesis FlgM
MRISDNEIKKLVGGAPTIVSAIVELGEVNDKQRDQDLVEQVVADVVAMPDREEMIADLRARIQAGTYNPSGDDIADAMIRRSIADRIR